MRIKTVFIICFTWLLIACSDSRLTLLDAESKRLSDFEGQWLLINYWAAWCKPCVKEIPELNEINARSDVTVLAFNYDNLDAATLRKQIKQFDVQYRSVMNEPAELFNQAKPTGLPATLLINPKGEFADWLYGAQSQESILAVIPSSP